jgi:hypothetical protein
MFIVDLVNLSFVMIMYEKIYMTICIKVVYYDYTSNVKKEIGAEIIK